MDFKQILKILEGQIKDINYNDENELDALEADSFQGNKKIKILSKDKTKKKAKVLVGTKSEIDKMDIDTKALKTQLGVQ